MTHPPFYIGLMSGTSADSIDACVVDFGDNTPRLVATQNEAIDAETKAAIHALTVSGQDELMRMGHLDQVMAAAFAKAALKVIEKAGISRDDVRAIGSHGQTIRHQPEGEYPF
ncbi:MAG: anhydro-N-acetylmuramic acid kinase, partial [Halieaceae bacterium]